MSFEMWSTFAVISGVLLQIPNSTNLHVVSYAQSFGPRTAIVAASGVALGDLTALSVTALGLEALMTSSALLFTALKWVGAAYLAHLGVRLWCDTPLVYVQSRPRLTSSIRMLMDMWAARGLNVGAACFFVAFLPTFIEPSRPAPPQMLALVATFSLLAFANAVGYAMLAPHLGRIVSDRRAVGVLNKTGAALLVGVAVATLAFSVP